MRKSTIMLGMRLYIHCILQEPYLYLRYTTVTHIFKDAAQTLFSITVFLWIYHRISCCSIQEVRFSKFTA